MARRSTYDVIPIRDYIDHIQREIQTEIDRRITSQQDATNKATAELNIRLGAMNEFRAAMSDIANQKVGREGFDQWARGIETRITSIETAEQVELRKRAIEAQNLTNERASVQQRVIILGVIIAFITIAVNILIAVKFH